MDFSVKVMDVDFYVNIRFLIEIKKLVGNVEAIASDKCKWNKIRISIADLFTWLKITSSYNHIR